MGPASAVAGQLDCHVRRIEGVDQGATGAQGAVRRLVVVVRVRRTGTGAAHDRAKRRRYLALGLVALN